MLIIFLPFYSKVKEADIFLDLDEVGNIFLWIPTWHRKKAEKNVLSKVP